VSRRNVAIAAGVAAALVAMVAFPAAYPFGKVAKGIAQGSVTGLLALGLVLVYRTTRVVNFAYGAMGGLGGSIGVLLYLGPGVPWPVCIVVSVAAGTLVGVITERVVIRRFSRSPRLVLTVATIGLAQILGGMSLLVPILFNRSIAESISSFSTSFSGLKWDLDPGQIDGNDLVIFAVVPVVLIGLTWFLQRTEAGMAVRAMAENQDRALLLGIPTRKLSTLVWAIIGGLAALTVILEAPAQGVPLDAAAGPTILLPALAAAIIARLRSLPVAFAAGIGLGIIDQVVAWNFPSKSATTTVVFLVVILVALLVQHAGQSRAEAADEASWTLAAGARPIPEELRVLPAVRAARLALPALALAAAVWFGTTSGPANLNRVSTAMVFGIAALSLVVLTGWSGTVSLGQFAIVGVGGITAANLLAKYNLDLFLTIGLSGLAGAAISLVIGLPALRVRGLFLAVTTLAFAVAMNTFFLNPVNFPDWIPSGYGRPILVKHVDLFSESAMYFLCLLALIGTVLVARSLRRSRPGRVLLASRDNARAAAAMAVPVTRTRISGFIIAGFIAGVAGALHATLLRGVGFGTYPPASSLLVFSMAVIGGISSITGALFGVALVQVISYAFPRVELVITGALVLVVLYVFPGGVGQFIDVVRDKVLARYARSKGIELKEHFADGTVDDDAGARVDAPAVYAGDGGGSAGPSLLQATGVTASYGPLQVLFGVDLDVREGEMVALLGTNGAGKSTILKAVSGLLETTGGSVTFAGESLAGLPADRIAAKGLALMPGGKGIFPTLTVAENLRLATWLLRDDRPAAARAREETLDLFPRLRERIDVAAGDLSGGEQQQLSLAMAFAIKPTLLCIDELSLGLAPTIVAQLVEKVRAIHASGTTVVVVEQSVTTALELAERGIFLEKGAVRFVGPTRDLLDRPDLLRSVFIGSAAGAAPAVTEQERDADASPRARGQRLQLRGVRKRFGGITVLQGVDLDVPGGTIVGLIGHNGAGKTTLFDVVSGFLEADGGVVVLGDEDITQWPPHARAAAGIGRSFQEARLYPSLSVHETVCVALDGRLASRDPVAAALGLPASLDAEAAAAERADELIAQLGLVGYRDHRTGELSTGTRRIVELACVLAQEPSVVLLDEPSAGVAQRETEALAPLLRKVQQETGCTMVIVEHDMGLMTSVCDHLVALEQGAVIAEGTPAEVLAHPAVIASYLGVTHAPDAAADSSSAAAPSANGAQTNGNGNGARRRREPLRAR
jgi:ABC-type branched-subunit amino acid transport system ATPase component/branched-subunit amino acid ABC-type transport system permease component